MSYWVIKTGNNTYWSATLSSWSAKVSDATRFLERSDASAAIVNIDDYFEEELSLIPYEVQP